MGIVVSGKYPGLLSERSMVRTHLQNSAEVVPLSKEFHPYFNIRQDLKMLVLWLLTHKTL